MSVEVPVEVTFKQQVFLNHPLLRGAVRTLHHSAEASCICFCDFYVLIAYIFSLFSFFFSFVASISNFKKRSNLCCRNREDFTTPQTSPDIKCQKEALNSQCSPDHEEKRRMTR